MNADFNQYMIFGDVDRDKCKQLHDLVVEFHDTIFTNSDVYDLLMEQGYEPDERADSFFAFNDAIMLRSKVLINLFFLNHTIELATKPHLLEVISNQPIVYTEPNPEEPEITLSEGGYDFKQVETFQKQWLANPEVTKQLTDYQSVLQNSFDQFNLNFILARIYSVKNSYIPDWEDIQKVKTRIDAVFESPLYTPMDNAYYNVARRHATHAGSLYEKVAQTEFGRMFLLSTDETQKAIIDAKRNSKSCI
jgi:hypothetical protein